MVRGADGASVSTEIGLADLLEPAPSCASAGDIAFADTVHVRDLPMGESGEHELPPPSGPVIVNDPDHGTQWMTPFAYPLPPASSEVSFATRLRVLASRIRHGWRGAVEDAREAWSETSHAPTLARRLQALLSFWDWERGDLVRAGIIGGAVFLVVATAGAIALDDTDTDEAGGLAAGARSAEVRAPRTVDQHTGRLEPRALGLRARR